MEDSDDIIEARPVLATAILLAVSAAAYAAVSVAMGGAVDPLSTGLFAVVFTAVYVAFAFYSEHVEAYLGRG